MEGRLLLAASLPTLDPGVIIQDGGQQIMVDYGDSTPDFADWNGDGKKDLLVGQYLAGNIWFFANKGTAASPSFNGKAKLVAGGQVISTSYG